MYKRIILIVLDSVGVGELPDANLYGDVGTNTLGNIARSQGGLFLPTMENLGLGCIIPLAGVKQVALPGADFGKLAEISNAKDTTSGHWEIAGCPVFTPFPTYPGGFPEEVTKKFTAVTGYTMLGNKPASGTVIIEELGEEHLRTGQPIVYTSADSVLQIAAHEDVISQDKLYALCQLVRDKVCIGRHAVGRVIARPFVGTQGNFTRTAGRHDYSLPPIGTTMLDVLQQNGYSVTGVGKIGDIFAQRGLTMSIPTTSNDDGMEKIAGLLQEDTNGLIMANLVEFDSLYGHRRNPHGYAAALQRFDRELAVLLDHLRTSDMLILTADHGCDPTGRGTDHTREYVPLLVYTHNPGKDLGIRKTFADISATVLDNFSLPVLKYGQSFLS